MGFKANITDMSNWMQRTLPGLKNFYMAGQWVFPGGGVPGAITSGRHLLQFLCKQNKKIFRTVIR
jgi:phytoene dehydrogenase-like protein